MFKACKEVDLLNYLKIDLELNVRDKIVLPPYKGSALRGGFGHAFKKVVCALRKKDCNECLLKHKCAYSYVFETPPPASSTRMRKYPKAPHPFIIEPPEEDKQIFEAGESLKFSIILIGHACEYLPYFVYAFEELGKMGIGRGKGHYSLKAVQSGGKTIYTEETRTLLVAETPPQTTIPVEKIDHLTIKFITPTRIIYEESLLSDPEFHSLFRNLLRRISSLSYFHCRKEIAPDFKGLIERAQGIKSIRKELTWIDWERYSARQDSRMKLGGFIGVMDFAGDLTEFMPYLRAGEIVHIGKASSFGLGKYQLI